MKIVASLVCALALLAPDTIRQDATAGTEQIAPPLPQRARFPIPSRSMSLTWQGDGPSVPALLEAYARATDRTVLVTQDTRQIVARQVVTIGPGTSRLDVPPEDVHEVFETLLRASDLVLLDMFGAERSSAVQVVSLQTQDRNGLKSRAIRLCVEDIEVYRRHPAVLVTTWVPVAEVTGAVSLATALRATIVDANVRTIAPAGQGIVLLGFGNDACELVDFVREVDALAGAGEALDQEAMIELVRARFPRPHKERQ